MPIGGIHLKIIDANGVELYPFEIGEIIVRGPALTKGYVGEPDLNRKVFHNGYFRTGDLGMLDDSGRIFIVGRKKKFINASGVKVDPVEIESVLLSFYKVREAHVVGMKSDRGTEIIKATLVTQQDCTVQEIIRYCKDKLADFKIPRIIELRDNIPRDLMGKVILYQDIPFTGG
jgi:long-chain acyl-CoA synthetase